jgi:YD repeat-containing protein
LPPGSNFNQAQTFDELGRLLQQIGANTQTTAFAYEKNGNLKSVTDPRSGLYAYGYDSLNRLIQTVDEETSQVNLTLDGQDNVTAYSDPRTLVTNYVRNGFGEVIQEASPDRGTTVTVRDARGLPTQITDGRSVVTQLTYDNAGRVLTKVYPAATGENLTYTYDDTTGGNLGKGRLTKITDQTGSTAFVYDVRGNVTTETRTISGYVHTARAKADDVRRLLANGLAPSAIAAQLGMSRSSVWRIAKQIERPAAA